jgi:hypothetical protein
LIRIGRLDRPYINALDCATRLWKEDVSGWRSFWRGTLIRTVGEFVSAPLNAMLQTPLYNVLHPLFGRFIGSVQSQSLKYAAATALGLLSGYPTILVKSPLSYAHVQLSSDVTSPLHSDYRFKNSMDVLDAAYRSGGLTTFATGTLSESILFFN